ncbi:Lrp/AsnC family transcriptional regulator [Streptomyces sp. MMG1121]|uniref:Lrp/AsnC family transcriptional regulator n=1 Tax=Streptomyces sp. MMG1121 TaxID=1415544 RepID=UPI0006AFCC8B|nr:Lrp/AsnC family transcriptional regulator [Streptomyces sp. MMG1121]KOV67882.1 AsnC family transcriptional regulator [Streptomyces sp. MMG1121]
MDELDSAIIRHLQLNARQSNRELARQIGVAPSTSLERVRSLEERGVITGYHAQLSLAALNRNYQAFVAAQVRPLSRTVITSFQEAVSQLPEVLGVFVVAGGDDFLIHVAVQSNEALHAFLMDRLSQRREVVGFRTIVIFQHAPTPLLSPLPEVNVPHSEGPAPRRGPKRPRGSW